MLMQCPTATETEGLTAEFWPEGLNGQLARARIVSLAPGVLCLATETPPAPGARFVVKFSIAGEFPVVVGCQARWRLQRSPAESWVSATFLTLSARDWDTLFAAWQRRPVPPGSRSAGERRLAAAGTASP